MNYTKFKMQLYNNRSENLDLPNIAAELSIHLRWVGVNT
jgi:hypothetical protein